MKQTAGIIVAIVLAVAAGVGVTWWLAERNNTADTPSAQANPTPAANTPRSTEREDEARETSEMVIPREEVARNNTPSACWTIIDGVVYDITSYIPRHPGGTAAISAVCGTDGTALFRGQAATANGQRNTHDDSDLRRIESLRLGTLAP